MHFYYDHNIILKVSEIPQVTVLAREAQLAQVLLNLLNNSFDAVEEITNKWVSIDVIDKDKKFQIRVTDSGAGIPSEILDKVMYPFFTTKEVGKGTGLGLSISKGIVEEHKGRIFIDPSMQNTCFVIEFDKYLDPVMHPPGKSVA